MFSECVAMVQDNKKNNNFKIISVQCITRHWIGLDWIEQCFTSPPTQYRLYGRRFLQVNIPNQQYQSTEGKSCKEKPRKRKQKQYTQIGNSSLHSKIYTYWGLKPNIHRRRRRDSTVELSCVGVASASAVYIGLSGIGYNKQQVP